MTSQNTPPGPGSEAGQERPALGPLALILSLVVGPLGAGMGAWLALRARRASQSVSPLAIAAIVVGIVQTVVVASVLTMTLGRSAPATGPGASPTPAVTYPSWTITPEPTIVTASPSPPPPDSLSHFVPATVGPSEAGEATPDQPSLDRGAVAAVSVPYASSKRSVQTVMAQWPSAEAAETFLATQASERFGTQTPLLAAPVPSGSMSYFNQDGEGVIYSRQGVFTMIVTGKESSVQDFFTQFPA